MSNRVPFGYEIVNGKAVINQKEAEMLTSFFTGFLQGKPLRQSGEEAGLPFVKEAFPKLIRRKEYSGTDYYPAIITEEYQALLISELEKRTVGKRKKSRKATKIQMDFESRESDMEQISDPVEHAAFLYGNISLVRAARKEKR